jgi:TetR/AcrR family transcriptional repressor of nem operon
MARTGERKQKTHERIVEAAAEAYRRFGLYGIGAADIMKRAGLTHGGFYAHFPSKDALVSEAVALAGSTVRSEFAKTAATAAPPDRLLAIAEAYLSSRHREHPESGCPVAALASELVRESAGVRQSFAGGIAALLDGLARTVDSEDAALRRRLANGAFAAMVGGVILSRALENSNDSDRLLEDVREFLRGALAAAKPS